MFGSTYYNALIQKYSALFGTLFNDITIGRVNASGVETQTMKVPIAYGPNEKYLARVTTDPTLDRGVAIQLPRMSFEIIDYKYDGSRKLPSTQKFRSKIANNSSAYASVFMPVPYNITFELTIMAKTFEDGARIVEQILPWFTPDWTVTAKLLDDMPDYKVDVPIILKSVETSDKYDEDYKERRVLTWTLTFDMKAEFYGKVSPAKIIKVATVNLYTSFNANSDHAVITTQPGMTANGQPTSDITKTISPYLIEEDDNWAYIITIEDVP